MSREWLADLKAGDKVLIDHGGRGNNLTEATVERITPTGKHRVNGRLFTDGSARNGGSWAGFSYLRPADPAVVADLKARDEWESGLAWLRYNAGRYEPGALPHLIKLVEALKAARGAK